MADLDLKPKRDSGEAEDAFEELYGLSDEVVAEVEAALTSEDGAKVQAILEPLHAADIADLMERLPSGDREAVIDALDGTREGIDAEILSHVDDSVREDLLAALNTEQLAQIVSDLESDDALDLIEDLGEAERQEVLEAVPADDRAILEQGLAYPDSSAGRLMRREVVTIPEHWTVGETIDFMRAFKADLPEDFYNLIIVTPTHRPIGMLPLSRLLRTKRPIKVATIMQTEPKLIPVTMDQEDAAFLFRQYALVEAPIVDDDGRLAGVITVDDIVHVLDEEHEEDILNLAGLKEDDFYADVAQTARLRFSWLFVNLLTAILASIVIAFFEATIQQVVALAVLMPIVASMGGNAGTQTLTVAVRALATNELTPANAGRIVLKEVLVGGVNGILFAILIGGLTWAWFGEPMIGVVIAAAMIINLLAAGLTGTMVPLLLQRLKVDPAVGSTVVLTTITDVIGFFAFLGLAALILF
ncbi:MAG: magnesium transporter [Alphaproteobacteria bacterium]|nr:magnesium transporter [Alphaproteobacteria bacterium]